MSLHTDADTDIPTAADIAAMEAATAITAAETDIPTEEDEIALNSLAEDTMMDEDTTPDEDVNAALAPLLAEVEANEAEEVPEIEIAEDYAITQVGGQGQEPVLEPAPEPAPEPESASDEEIDPLALGNDVTIISDEYGYTIGRIIYRSNDMVRVMPSDASDRAIEFPLINGGTEFSPAIGVIDIEVSPSPYAYYVDLIGAKPGETLEFFTKEGNIARPVGIVESIIKTPSQDAIKLTDGTVLEFHGIGPEPPIAVIRVRTSMNVPAATEMGAPIGADDVPAIAARQLDIAALLREAMPISVIGEKSHKERIYPDSLQREDLFQDVILKLSAKQRKNPRRIRNVERMVDLFMSLKNTATEYDRVGSVVGPAPYLIDTLKDVLTETGHAIPAAIPIVEAARVLNLDENKEEYSYKKTDVQPRVLAQVEEGIATTMSMYLEENSSGPLSSYLYGMLSEAQTLVGSTTHTWKEDQDIIRTDGLDNAVQALSIDPATYNDKDTVISLAQLSSDTADRYMRVLKEDHQTLHRYGSAGIIAPSDPSTIKGFVVIPTKAALSLRPPKRPGDLPTALIYSAALQDTNLPTVAEALSYLYTTRDTTQQDDSSSFLNAYTLDKATADDTRIAEWLREILKYAVHPVDSLGPRGPRLLSVLDTLGVGMRDLSPSVYAVIMEWVRGAQALWRDILVAERTRIQALLTAETERQFYSVTGEDSPTWQVLRDAVPLRGLLEDIQRSNPTIFGAPTLLTSALLKEAQGDAMPLVWSTLSTYDGRELPDLDIQLASASLAASRAYLLRRKALRDLALLQLHAEPEINTCPHVAKLEAIRNLADPLPRAQLLREFVEQYQGGKAGNWITCVVCKQECVCFHELMELEALAQPRRLESIQKQILIQFGGGRYEGKIICKNCGQGLQDMDYDDSVEFDDNGKPIIQSSVLTEEQMADPEESVWKRSTAALVAAPMAFHKKSQQEIADILTILAQEGGMQIPDVVFSDIVKKADQYVILRLPSERAYTAAYEKRMQTLRSAASTSAGGKLKAPPDMPTYAQITNMTRVAAVAALTAFAIQTSIPAIRIPSPQPSCQFSRDGWPLNGTSAPDAAGPLFYIACVLSFVQKDYSPWNTLMWISEPVVDARRKKILDATISAMKSMLGEDPRSPPIAFTPALRTAIEETRSNVTGRKEREMVSNTDVLPPGFLPEPFPPKIDRPALERDPLPRVEAAVAAGDSIAPLVPPIANALRQQAIAIVGELHAAANSEGTRPNATVCCPTPIAESLSGQLLGAPESLTLVQAGALLRGAIPTAPIAGTHLWSRFVPPEPQPVNQSVEEGVLFKLFLKYCYFGPTIGDPHEFSAGNVCRQCGLNLGKSPDTIDFAGEGAAILAAQQGDLRIDPTQAAFEALSGAVRRRRTIAPPREGVHISWRKGLELLVGVSLKGGDGMKTAGERLQSVLAVLAGKEEEFMDDLTRAMLWENVLTYTDELTAYVERATTPAQRRGAPAAATETVMGVFNQITEDPFISGPRTIQEYWCAKTEAAGQSYAVVKVNGAKWFNISPIHNEKLNKILSDNAAWFSDEITDGMRTILRRIGLSLGPVLRAWQRAVRPAPVSSGPWTVTEAQAVLRMFVLQSWADALNITSWMYADVPNAAEHGSIARGVANWTRRLMLSHVKIQFVRYSKERIAQVLQQRAELERTSVVQEFSSIADPDSRAAFIAMKQLKIGRWAKGADIRKLDPSLYEAEVEQRHKMGIIDAPVDHTLIEGVGAPADTGFGFADLGGAPEDGYDASQAADGDDY